MNTDPLPKILKALNRVKRGDRFMIPKDIWLEDSEYTDIIESREVDKRIIMKGHELFLIFERHTIPIRMGDGVGRIYWHQPLGSKENSND